jgi:hypothetical protein
MATNQTTDAVPNGNGVPDFTVKSGLAQMLKGGVIMDVVNAEQVCRAFPSAFFFCLMFPAI